MSKNIKKEGEIDDYPLKASIDVTEKIIDQSKQCTCRIQTNNTKGTAFSCKFFNKDENREMKVLITNNHVVGENELKQKSIQFSNYNGKRYGQIELDKSRNTFTNKTLDITIIELKEKDNINKFLELDDNFLENKDHFFIKQPIYTLFYSDNNSYISYGIIKDIQEKEIFHTCSTRGGASGSPVCLLDSQKVIGIHVGFLNEDKENKANICISFKYVLSEFLNYLEDNKNKNKKVQDSIFYYEPSPNKIKHNLNNKQLINPLDISHISDNNEKSINKLKVEFKNHKMEIEEDERSLKNIYNEKFFINIRNPNNLKLNNKLNNNINNNKINIKNHNLNKNYSSSNINTKLNNNITNQNYYFNNMNLNNQLINKNKNIVINNRVRQNTPSKLNNNNFNAYKFKVNSNIAKNNRPPNNNFKNNNNINQNINQNNSKYITNNLNNNNYNNYNNNNNYNNYKEISQIPNSNNKAPYISNLNNVTPNNINNYNNNNNYNKLAINPNINNNNAYYISNLNHVTPNNINNNNYNELAINPNINNKNAYYISNLNNVTPNNIMYYNAFYPHDSNYNNITYQNY